IRRGLRQPLPQHGSRRFCDAVALPVTDATSRRSELARSIAMEHYADADPQSGWRYVENTGTAWHRWTVDADLQPRHGLKHLETLHELAPCFGRHDARDRLPARSPCDCRGFPVG